MKYTVEKLEVKTTSTGKVKMDAELKSVDGIVVPSVTLWGDFPNFESITFGSEVEGDLVAAKDPKYGPTLYPARNSAPIRRASSGVAKAMEQKEKSIEKFQDSKEASIKVSSTMRDAVILAVAELGSGGENEVRIKEAVVMYRRWLWAEWENYKDFPPFE